VHAGLEVRITAAPGGQEVFHPVPERRAAAKEQAMHERFESGLKRPRKDSDQLPEEETEAVTIATRVGGCWAEHASSSAVRGEGGSGWPAASPAYGWSKVKPGEVGALERGAVTCCAAT